MTRKWKMILLTIINVTTKKARLTDLINPRMN